MATGTVYGFRSQNEANRFRDLLVAHFRPWVPGGLKMVQDALQVVRDLPRGIAFSYPWTIVYRQPDPPRPYPQPGIWILEIDNFALRATAFVQGVRMAEQLAKKAARCSLTAGVKRFKRDQKKVKRK